MLYIYMYMICVPVTQYNIILCDWDRVCMYIYICVYACVCVHIFRICSFAIKQVLKLVIHMCQRALISVGLIILCSTKDHGEGLSSTGRAIGKDATIETFVGTFSIEVVQK